VNRTQVVNGAKITHVTDERSIY